MKLTNLAKSVLAASALTVASFGANAGAIATSSLKITNLHFNFTEIGAQPLGSAVTFSGSQATASINNIGSNDAWANGDTISPKDTPLELSWSEGSAWDSTGTGAAAKVYLEGSLLDGNSNGLTSSAASAYGINSALGTSKIENTFNTTFTALSNADTVFLDISFGWAVSLYSEITDSVLGQTASSEYEYYIEFEGQETGDYEKIDLRTIIGGAAKKTQKELGFNSLTHSGKTTDEQFKFKLNANEQYDIAIVQRSESNVVSVTEPTSVAILGLSLLGFAGAARRRKS